MQHNHYLIMFPPDWIILWQIIILSPISSYISVHSSHAIFCIFSLISSLHVGLHLHSIVQLKFSYFKVSQESCFDPNITSVHTTASCIQKYIAHAKQGMPVLLLNMKCKSCWHGQLLWNYGGLCFYHDGSLWTFFREDVLKYN